MVILPDEITKAELDVPRDLVIIAPPKMGKSTILAALTRERNAVIFNIEKGGYDYLDARVMNIYPTQDTTFFEAYLNYIAIRDTLLQNKGKYEYLIIDVLTELDKFSELGGTLAYMQTTIGKSFNKNPKTGEPYHPTDNNFRPVTSLPNGAGYKHTRDWFMDQIEIFSRISPFRIYAAHIKDKLLAKEEGKEEVSGHEINLTGQLKTIFSSRVTSLCRLIADKNKRLLSFEINESSVIVGSRFPKLKGQILISEVDDNSQIKTYWNNIYEN